MSADGVDGMADGVGGMVGMLGNHCTMDAFTRHITAPITATPIMVGITAMAHGGVGEY